MMTDLERMIRNQIAMEIDYHRERGQSILNPGAEPRDYGWVEGMEAAANHVRNNTYQTTLDRKRGTECLN